ncbi:MAG: phosphatidate cytidylyltransferase [Rhodothermales bacterium]|nr:phosphatidate cytidylyltransferase [Rhodothermales bacterium]
MRSSAARIVTALIAAPIAVYLVYLGGWPFLIGLALIGAVAQNEVYHLLHPKMDVVIRCLGLSAGIAIIASVYVNNLLWIAAALVILIVCILPVRKSPESGKTIAAALAGIIYPASLIALVAMLRFGIGLTLDQSELFILTTGILVILWATDSAAYFVGRAIGKRPLAPSISPGKTIEGAVGGLAGAAIVAIGFKALFAGFITWIDVGAFVIICGLLSPLGDLAESMLKRSAGAKDSGNILPGHGGALDRIDALVVALPLCYLYLRFASSL